MQSLYEKSSHWLDEQGEFALLHQLNYLRIQFIKDEIHSLFNKDATTNLEDLTILDVGCGAGILSRPLAKLGAKITGLDQSYEAIELAKEDQKLYSAQNATLDILYQNTELSEFESVPFDVIVASEVIEHVENKLDFLKHCYRLLKPKGILILSTLTKTIPSGFLGIFMAEHILKLTPLLTHEFKYFITPQKLLCLLLDVSFSPKCLKGMGYSLLKKEWFFTSAKNLHPFSHIINFIMSAQKA
jgi:2-polyprenyl-6-hydroxyphenyl methylase/3-demethylubiquinone-9 3-methyltransferase